jgi:hypothetical protein
MDETETHVIGRHLIVLNFRDDVGPASAYSLLLAENIPDLTGKTAVDLGTGSGILAIVAALQGAATVYLLDTYDKAISLALENGKRNGNSIRNREAERKKRNVNARTNSHGWFFCGYDSCHPTSLKCGISQNTPPRKFCSHLSSASFTTGHQRFCSLSMKRASSAVYIAWKGVTPIVSRRARRAGSSWALRRSLFSC